MTELLKIDFTGSVSSFHQYRAFDSEVVRLIRSWSAKNKVLVLLDRGHQINKGKSPYLVRDHLNLTGTNPLMGPNHPCGERFTKIDDVYITDLPNSLTAIIAAGLAPNVVPSAQEEKVLKSIGADCWCYNLVPTVLVAAHAGFKVLGILLPETSTKLEPELDRILTTFNGIAL